ncbi:DUF4843 domain-containing protein [Chitinophaga silvatica]|uniref:DUF4843 domain-containing protein n=1 Tax=Chitinophaga silvatica TaxID=2282649 RepID=A0A3E1Y8U6_9BACT|nr:DUF4843 domain-containing protein [Chitinophaga silvatica]RFS21771.1 DUF4843 domain-containing protein [Chitinophaga silvatica]
MKLRIYIIALAAIAVSSCKKSDELMYNRQDSYIYFTLPFKLNQYNVELAERVDSISYSFAFDLPNTNQYTFKVPVSITGTTQAKDRSFNIEIDKENTTAVENIDYVPFSTTQVVRAGRVSDTIYIKVNKTLALSTSYKQLVLKLHSGTDFQLGAKEYQSAKISFTDILEQPKWWKTWQTVFGTYSKEKYKLWINLYKKGVDPSPDVYDNTKTYFYYWDNMPTFTGVSTFPILYMYVKQLKDFLLANPTYIDNDPTKERVTIPYNF